MKIGVIALALLISAGCTDLKPLESRLDDLQEQVNKLHAEIAKSANDAAAANKSTAASAAAAHADATKALSLDEANTKAIEAVNAKIDNMFKKRPAEQ